ncbi:DUF3630 family protein [Alteromonas halophila]|uniref:DUF3630 family protein n=1 Tax=Alteromonas halophila TaxID=516698 RepID=A0A918JKF3_9ALTE|nr:DUF3630 family protein [Alteromonas halophila]GGW84356.1 hypothetical protein GCM10007391_17600 [Alteromonas halophila]
MQQLTAADLRLALIISDDVISLKLPLPAGVAATNQWVKQFCALTGCHLLNHEWGADRYQAHLQCNNYRLLLCIEWLCEAIWLERAAGEPASLTEIVSALKAVDSSQNRK